MVRSFIAVRPQRRTRLHYTALPRTASEAHNGGTLYYKVLCHIDRRCCYCIDCGGHGMTGSQCTLISTDDDDAALMMMNTEHACDERKVSTRIINTIDCTPRPAPQAGRSPPIIAV